MSRCRSGVFAGLPRTLAVFPEMGFCSGGEKMETALRNDSFEIVRPREPMRYTRAEQQFSLFVQKRMYRLLRGDDNDLLLMRRYYARKKEVAFFLPSRVEKGQIRPDIAEGIVYGVLRFLDPFAPGGPIAQDVTPDRLIETQTFPTQYPHIVVERTDVFRRPDQDCLYVEWRAVRLQNQRKSTLINRALDMSNLALEIAKFVRLP